MMARALFYLLNIASVVVAQKPKIVSMYINEQDTVHTPLVTGSVIAADKTATTYALACKDNAHIAKACPEGGLTVTIGPSWQAATAVLNGTSISERCTFTGSTDGSCEVTRSFPGETTSSFWVYSWAPATATEDPNASHFPGFVQMLVTGGKEKGAATATATVTSTGAVEATSIATSTAGTNSSARATESPVSSIPPSNITIIFQPSRSLVVPHSATSSSAPKTSLSNSAHTYSENALGFKTPLFVTMLNYLLLRFIL